MSDLACSASTSYDLLYIHTQTHTGTHTHTRVGPVLHACVYVRENVLTCFACTCLWETWGLRDMFCMHLLSPAIRACARPYLHTRVQ
jgi:hypothetical protein